MAKIVRVWSDIHCPWATVAVHRLRVAREHADLDVVFDPRPWPLELVNRQGVPYHIVEQEVSVLAGEEPELFSALAGALRPSTFLPSFELVAAAHRFGGPRAAEEVDYQLRLAFFRDSVDVSIRRGLEMAVHAAAEAKPDLQLDPIALLSEWDRGEVRADVLADYEHSKGLPIQGSPQIFWPDGTTAHNPGLADHKWLRGIPRIHSGDPQAPARLLREALVRAGTSSGLLEKTV